MQARRVVAIHQPNFLPWLGYFDKLARCDLFLVMDNAQFSKTGGTWSNRVRVLVNGAPAWLTVPIVRSYHGVRAISEMKINDQTPWRSKMLKTLEMSYKRAPHFAATFPLLTEIIEQPTDDLTQFNVTAIRRIAEVLEIDTRKLVFGSTLETSGRATDLLIEMVQAVGGTTYLCGGGAGEYQKDDAFPAAGIDLLYQNFVHPTYAQFGAEAFVPGLSIIDALMSIGAADTRLLLDRP